MSLFFSFLRRHQLVNSINYFTIHRSPSYLQSALTAHPVPAGTEHFAVIKKSGHAAYSLNALKPFTPRAKMKHSDFSWCGFSLRFLENTLRQQFPFRCRMPHRSVRQDRTTMASQIRPLVTADSGSIWIVPESCETTMIRVFCRDTMDSSASIKLIIRKRRTRQLPLRFRLTRWNEAIDIFAKA